MLRLLFQVALFLKFHRTTSTLLEEVLNWGERRPIFDAELFIIDMMEETKNRSEVDEDPPEVPMRNTVQINSPEDMYNHYK